MALLDLWSELLDAEHGTNGFGGHVAEIYAFRFGQLGPTWYLNRGASTAGEDVRRSAVALHDLLALFIEKRQVTITVDGVEFGAWVRSMPFDHRAHVSVATRSR